MITCRKRVVQFVQKWVIAVRNAVFEDPVAVDFIEVNSLFNIGSNSEILDRTFHSEMFF